MIRYALKCKNEHGFDSWFQSADAFEKLRQTGLLTCPQCGETQVEKAIMAPVVSSARAPSAPPDQKEKPLSVPASEIERSIAELKAKIEASSEYVGESFASEARAIHEGSAPERAIYGEANPADARALIEDGVPVAPLPFAFRRKVN